MKISDDKLMGMFENINNKLDAIHVQTTKTNGRVTNLEKEMYFVKKKSIGTWISNNPYKFALFFIIYLILTLSILVTESNEIIVDFIKMCLGL